MEELKQPNNEFNFEKLKLSTPMSMNNGNYFLKYTLDNNPLYLEVPKCIIKQGFIKASKRVYCDLMFTNENEEFITWLENLETYSQKKIFENRSEWFETELDESDIENSFTSLLKPFKSGKYYILRVSVPINLGKVNLKIYDEYEQEKDLDEVKENTKVLGALEIKGIKCSSRSFNIEIELKQMLILNEKNIFDKCILKSSNSKVLEEINNKNNLDSIKENLEDIIEDNELDNKKVIETEVLDVDNEIKIEDSEDNNIKIELEEKNEEELDITEDKVDKINENQIEKENQEDKEENDILETKEESEEENEEGNEEMLEVTEEGIESKELIQDILEENKENNEIPEEIDLTLDELEDETVSLKKRNDIYYEMYKDALRKAKMAKDLALNSFLEAKRIKNTYMLDDLDDSDLEEEESVTTNDE